MEDKEFLEKLKSEREKIITEIDSTTKTLKSKETTLSSINLMIDYYSRNPTTIENLAFFAVHSHVAEQFNLSYPKDGTWKEKVLYILKNSSVSMKAKEVIERIEKEQPNQDPILLPRVVSQTLWDLKKKGLLNHENLKYSIKEQ